MFRTEEMEIGSAAPVDPRVLRLVLQLDGEEIKDVRPVIGYLHRGVEKLCEHRTYAMIEPLTDRLDYVAAISENLGWCGAVEALLGVTPPPRASYIRVVLAELQRIASHLLWLGTHALDLGAMTVFFTPSASAS
jgi:NADH-quinone oxidoreductase subunit D